MKTPTPISGFTFTKEPYDDIVQELLALPSWESELLGESVNGRPIYGFSHGDTNKPVMYVHSNIHGWHEWRTLVWTLGFMKLVDDPSTLASDTRTALADVLDRYRLYFIPSVNPDGYGTASTNGPYTNANGVSVSENFDYNWAAGVHTPPHDEYRGPYAWSEPESQIVRDKVLQLRPVSLLCNHTWGSSTVGWTTRHPQNSDDDPAITVFFNEIKSALGYSDNDYNQQYSGRLPTGSAYNWAGTQTSSVGRNIIGQVWESGGGMTDEEQSRVGMTGILYHLLMVDWMLGAAPGSISGETGEWGPLRLDGVDVAVVRVDAQDSGTLKNIYQR